MTPKEYVLKYVPDARFDNYYVDRGWVCSDNKSRCYASAIPHRYSEEQAWEVAAQMIKAERLEVNEGWMSVDDELPDLVIYPLRIRIEGVVCFEPALYNIDSKKWFSATTGAQLVNVTHWKPFETDTLID